MITIMFIACYIDFLDSNVENMCYFFHFSAKYELVNYTYLKVMVEILHLQFYIIIVFMQNSES